MTAGPLVIGVSDLTKRVGTRKNFTRTIHLEGVSLSSAEVIDDVAIDVVLESLSGVITLTGSIETRWKGACRRCLDDVIDTLEIDVRERFEQAPLDEDSYVYSGDHIDLGPVVREAVMLALPLAPLCSGDCQGPDPEAHPTGSAAEMASGDTDPDGEPARDPRWAALDQIKFD